MYKYDSKRRRPSLPEAPVPDWSRLCRNDNVEVRSSNGTIIAGTIDMIASDRSVFWMIRTDGAGRTMVYFGDDVSVTRVTQQRELAAA